ncbi:LysR family transcriptional regulator [Nocardioides immobilis]|uniref:LysR family transcriptional regulator n=1 Tax=Nocardioides immobilis TaxID=2049295 RepID=A0A417Y9H8_9ACTN|nr:LysR family transcriptional regulator [Nocardioides immobilis]RHW29176.1 LysR family transcriptional regulator [Nocardioides immobilis]
MELRHLTYFQVVAELGSIAKAAATLRMTQPTLSRQLAYLERSLGYPLLARTTRGTSLTPAGIGLYDHLQGVFQQLEQIPEVLRSSHARLRTVSIGVPPGLPQAWFTHFRVSVEEADTRLRLAVFEATSEEQVKLLLGRHIDVGLVHAEPPRVASAKVLTQPLGCAFSEPRPRGRSSALTYADLDGLRVMAHAQTETPGEETRLRSAAEAAGAKVDWMFRPFSHHGRLIAEAADVDAVVVGEETALKEFAGWEWLPFRKDEENAEVVTWAIWDEPVPPDLTVCLIAMQKATSHVERWDYGG